MRTIASMPQLIATTDAEGVQLHQFASAEIRTQAPDGGPIRLRVATDYPWSGGVDVTVVETPDTPWTLTIRIPGWSTAATITGADGGVRGVRGPSVEERRQWAAGDRLSLALEVPVRITTAHPRVDAVRGCVALERGPLVYCLETDDLPSGIEIEEVAVHPAVEPQPVPRDDVADGIVGLSLPAKAQAQGRTSTIEVGAIPYFAWGNRAVDAMRVWIPTDPSAPAAKVPV
jgi:DUF1680 family protein